MKLSLFKTTAAGLMAFVAVYALTAVVAHAQDTSVNVSGSVQTQTPPPGTRPPIGTQIRNNIEQNKEMRNNLLEQKQDVHKDLKAEVKGIRADAKGEMKEARENMRGAASTSMMMFKRDAKDARKEMVKKMEEKVFAARKDALVKELNLSLTNITDIAARIDTRMTKAEAEGHTLTDARALLVTANAKLVKAKADVAAFQALSIASSTSATATASTTVQVDLAKPRALGDAAIKSVKDARDAFQKVVVSIAHSMGVKAGANASTTVDVRVQDHQTN
jgi:hypothetical protein